MKEQKQRTKPSLEIYRPPGRREKTCTDGKATNLPSISNDDECNDIPICGSSSDSKMNESVINNSKNASKISNKKSQQRKSSFKDPVEIFQLVEELCIKGDLQELIISLVSNNAITDDECEAAQKLGNLLVLYTLKYPYPTRPTAKLCALLSEWPYSGSFVQRGILSELERNFVHRVQLRMNNYNVWITFIKFSSDLYLSFGSNYDGPLIDLLLKSYEYLLEPQPTMELKLEELEYLLASLLTVGNYLDQSRPDAVGKLRNSIRDCFLESRELWARKMLLMLVELAANGWSLKQTSNDYYLRT